MDQAKQTHTTIASTEAAPSRRSLLSFLTGTVAVAGVTALPASTAKAAPAIEETPELLAIGERLPTLIEAYRVAKQHKAEAAAKWEELRPTATDDLVENPKDRFLVLGRALLKIEPATMAGIMIAARATAALGEVIDDEGREAPILCLAAAIGRQVAEALIRIQAEQAAT